MADQHRGAHAALLRVCSLLCLVLGLLLGHLVIEPLEVLRARVEELGLASDHISRLHQQLEEEGVTLCLVLLVRYSLQLLGAGRVYVVGFSPEPPERDEMLDVAPRVRALPQLEELFLAHLEQLALVSEAFERR